MGRNRDEELRQRVLAAAYQLLATMDFHHISLNLIARHASVASATLYRWWQSRDQVLFDAVSEHVHGKLVAPGTGTPLMRYKAYLLHACDFLNSLDGQVFHNFFIGVRADRALHRLYIERYWIKRYKLQTSLIEAAIFQGELPADTDPDEIFNAINGPMFFAWYHGHCALTRRFTEKMFDRIIRTFQH